MNRSFLSKKTLKACFALFITVLMTAAVAVFAFSEGDPAVTLEKRLAKPCAVAYDVRVASDDDVYSATFTMPYNTNMFAEPVFTTAFTSSESNQIGFLTNASGGNFTVSIYSTAQSFNELAGGDSFILGTVTLTNKSISGSVSYTPSLTKVHLELDGENFDGSVAADSADAVNTSTLASLHTWGSYSVTKAPSTSAAGTITRTCKKNSSHTQTVTVSKLNTTDYTTKTTAPTCTAAGYTTYTWKKNSTYGVSVVVKVTGADATGHTWKYKINSNPTWIKKGSVTFSCTKCSATHTMDLPLSSSTRYKKSTQAATCTTPKYNVYTISLTFTKDGRSYTQNAAYKISDGSALGHSWGAWKSDGSTTHTRTCTRDASHKETQNHSYTSAVTTQATCVAKGVRTYTCSACSRNYTEDIAINPSNHTGRTELRDAAAATCTTPGYSGDTYCADCDKLISSGSVIAALGHDYDYENAVFNWSGYTCATAVVSCKVSDSHEKKTVDVTVTSAVTTAPGCTTKGVRTYTAAFTVDGKQYTSAKTQSVAATGHSWSAYSITKDPSASEEGVLTRTCANDSSHTQTVKVPKLNSDDYTVTSTAASCASDGYKTYTWNENETYGVSVVVKVTEAAATGHTWTYNVTKQPYSEKGFLGIGTNYYEGSVTFTCSVCGATVNASMPTSNSGSYTETTQEPTCTEKGYRVYTTNISFSKDGKNYTQKVSYKVENASALGHSWGAWVSDGEASHTRTCTRDDSHTQTEEHTFDSGVVTTAATCVARGVKTYTCTGCAYSYTEKIAKDPSAHTGNTEVRDAVEATCTAEGYSGDTYCVDCGVMISEGAAIPKLDHTWDDGSVTAPATCVAEGEKTYTCTVCGETKTEAIPVDADNHSWDKGTVTTAATCVAEGEKTYTCSACGATKTEPVPVNPDNHAWDAGAVTTAATCVEEGERTYNCIACGATSTEPVAVDPDNHTGNTEVRDAVAATCTAEGYTGDTYCADCGAKLADGEAVSAAGHVFSDWTVITPATVLAEGLEERVCSVCGAVEQRAVPVLTEVITITDPDETAQAVFEKDAFAEGAEVSIARVEGGETLCSAYSQLPYSELVMYELAAYADSERAEAGKPIAYRIDIPEGFSTETLEVYRVDGDGVIEAVDFSVEDGAAVFEGLDGAYVVADTAAVYEVPFVLGDLDLDGQVTAADARVALRISVGLEEQSYRQSITGDVNFDMDATPADARAILRKVVNLEDFVYPAGYKITIIEE
ncbi:MAG: dockerin type I repeat-containing protein [Clostridia bacterium]|nr:dockerin type I repeat-containing protein [Clostridia bacterium]